MLEWVEERGWCLANGTKWGDEEGEFTYVGARGASVIDYLLVNAEGVGCVKGV